MPVLPLSTSTSSQCQSTSGQVVYPALNSTKPHFLLSFHFCVSELVVDSYARLELDILSCSPQRSTPRTSFFYRRHHAVANRGPRHGGPHCLRSLPPCPHAIRYCCCSFHGPCSCQSSLESAFYPALHLLPRRHWSHQGKLVIHQNFVVELLTHLGRSNTTTKPRLPFPPRELLGRGPARTFRVHLGLPLLSPC